MPNGSSNNMYNYNNNKYNYNYKLTKIRRA